MFNKSLRSEHHSQYITPSGDTSARGADRPGGETYANDSAAAAPGAGSPVLAGMVLVALSAGIVGFLAGLLACLIF